MSMTSANPAVGRHQDVNTLLAHVLEVARTVPLSVTRVQLASFFRSAVNGDRLIDSLSFATTLSEGQAGILLYVLTSAKLIKVEIDAKGLRSSDAYLVHLVGITRSVFTDADGEPYTKIGVEFIQGGGFGLRYSTHDSDVTEFFSSVDQAAREASHR